jgi:hypothetical protein
MNFARLTNLYPADATPAEKSHQIGAFSCYLRLRNIFALPID